MTPFTYSAINPSENTVVYKVRLDTGDVLHISLGEDGYTWENSATPINDALLQKIGHEIERLNC